MIRRHTVGPGDSRRERISDPTAYDGSAGNEQCCYQFQPIANVMPNTLPLGALPNTNLAHNIPQVQNQPLQNFSVKDQHLLKPPQVMGAGTTGRIKKFWGTTKVNLSFFKIISWWSW